MCTRLEVFTLAGQRFDVDTAGELAAVLECDAGDLPTFDGKPMDPCSCLCGLDVAELEKCFLWRVDTERPGIGCDASLIQLAWGGRSLWRERMGGYGIASAQCHATPGKHEYMAWAVIGPTVGENPLQEAAGDCWFVFADTRGEALANLRAELEGLPHVSTH